MAKSTSVDWKDVTNTGESIRQDAEQQTYWKAAYKSATEKLIFSGEFKDKGEQIRLLQFANVVKRTAKQIHIVVAYMLYHTKITQNGTPVAWSISPTGGAFGKLYTEWGSVTRYRLRRIAKVSLYSPDVLNIPKSGEPPEERCAHIQAWKRLCGVHLFSNEDEYALWHLARYENEAVCAEGFCESTGDFPIKKPDSCKILKFPAALIKQR